MNKRDLVTRVADEAHLTRVQAAKAIDAFVHGIQEGLQHGDRVALSGFGTFAVAARKARRVRNPRGGDAIRIPARRVPRFSPGLELREAIASSAESPAQA